MDPENAGMPPVCCVCGGPVVTPIVHVGPFGVFHGMCSGERLPVPTNMLVHRDSVDECDFEEDEEDEEEESPAEHSLGSFRPPKDIWWDSERRCFSWTVPPSEGE